MATSLVFDKGPATGQPVHLVFGDDGGSAGNTVPLTLAATLPGLGAHITAGKRSALSVSASLPGPRVVVRLVFAHPAAVAATLPGLGAHVHAQRKRPGSLHGTLPALGVHVSLLPIPGANVVATLPRLGAAIALGRVRPAAFRARLPSLGVSIALDYIVNTREPVISGARGRLQDAARLVAPMVSRLQSGAALPSATLGTSTWGNPLASVTTGHYQDATRRAQPTQTRQQPAMPMPAAPVRGRWQDAIRTRNSTQGRMQDGTPVQSGTRMRYQDADRTKRAWLHAAIQQGAPIAVRLASSLQQGVFHPARLRGVEQDAMPPPPGRWPGRPIPPAWDPCYLPPNGLHVDLLFQEEWTGSTELVFVCGRHGGPEPGATVVVPIRRVYMTVNQITLRRVAGNIPLPASAFSMSVDADSWTWGWSATMPAEQRQHLIPVDGIPVEVEATVNGVPYRLVVESISRDRTFAKSRISVQGRGLAAALDAPYAPVYNFGNTAARTAQQLMTDVLTHNGVGIGWSVDWGLTDWLVPGGLWTLQGTYIEAVNAIASAAGGYVQPHATTQTLRILPRYPSMPWDWATTTPDIELPSAVVSVEGIEWHTRPQYDRVFVSGVAGGVLAQATRAGTAGALLAPMVTDSLITHADAARQRAAQVLADVGAQARVTLRLPVLPETGLITPGKLVRYTDGPSARLGLVRSTALDWSAPTLRQSITLETHGID